MKKEYKKSYKLLFVWFLAFMVIMVGIPLILYYTTEIKDNDLTRITMAIMLLMLAALMTIIYSGEYVYWINGGPDFETAKKAGSSKRKAYAGKYAVRFYVAAIIGILYLLVSKALSFSPSSDIIIVGAIVVVTALFSVSIRFDE